MKLIKQAEELARNEQMDSAVKKFKEAQELDARLVRFDIETKVKQLLAFGLLETGEQLVKEGEIEAAVVKFTEAQAIDSRFIFDANKKVRQLAAIERIGKGAELAEQGQIEQAITKYQEAQQMDVNLKISAWQWNRLCWYGSLYEQTTRVMEVCEKAVALAPENRDIRESRALARTLLGNFPGAIEDFQFALEKYGDEQYQTKTQAWINALKKGQNPFTKEVLEELR